MYVINKIIAITIAHHAHRYIATS